MDNRVLEIFGNFNDSSNCYQASTFLASKLAERGYNPLIRRVAHKSNIFGGNPCLLCEHVCGESYVQHFVVELEDNILDPKLRTPVRLEDYLKKTYLNSKDLRLS